MKLVVLLAFLCGGYVFAEDKTCAVKGMHCEDCVSAVQNKVCNDTYSTCDVKIGKVHLVTKDAAAKVDEKAVSAEIKDAGYTMKKCTNGKAKASKKHS